MRSQQYMDLVFIFAYGSEFVLMSILLWWRSFRLAKIMAVFSGFSAVVAAGLDVREDLLILNVVSKPVAQVDGGLVQLVRYTTMTKWSLLYIAMILLAFVFVGRHDQRAGQNDKWRFLVSLSCITGWFSCVTGWLFLGAAIVGLIGIGSELMLTSVAPTFRTLTSRAEVFLEHGQTCSATTD